MAAWRSLTALRPPAAANGGARVAYSPAHGLILAHPQGGVQLWRWTGGAWTLLASGLLGDGHYSTPQICSDADDTWVLSPSEGALAALRLSDRAVTRLPLPGLPPYTNHGLSGFDPERGAILLHINGDDGGQTLAFDGEALRPLGRGPYLLSGCFDPRRGQLVGVDVHNRLHGFDGQAWTALGKAPRFTSSDIAYDPSLGLVRLVATGDAAMSLYAEAGGAWRDTGRVMRPVMASAVLAVDAQRGQLISFGGQDFRASGDHSDGTWVAHGGDFEELQAGLNLGRHTTPGRLGGRLAAVNHSTLGVDVLEGEAWTPWRAPWAEADRPEGGRLYDLSVNFAVGADRVVMLDGEGALWQSVGGADWTPLSPPGAGPRSRYARRVAMACDADTVVVFGGESQNDTWVFEGATKAWRALPTEDGPAPGIGSMVHTPEGFYLLALSDLWRLDGGAWVCVASEDGSRGRHLRFDPTRGLLLAVINGDDDGRPRLCALSGGAWRRLAPMPEDQALVSGGSGDGELGVDPASGQALILSKAGALGLALDALELPPGELPTRAVAPHSAAPSGPSDPGDTS